MLNTLLFHDYTLIMHYSSRINNDCEGEHHRRNRRIGRFKLNCHGLAEFMAKEASKIAMDAKLVNYNKMDRDRSKATLEKDRQLQEVWANYNESKADPVIEKISPLVLLKQISSILRPQPRIPQINEDYIEDGNITTDEEPPSDDE